MKFTYLLYARRFIEKTLSFGYVPFSGRNFSGRVCVRHQGGGSKRKLQVVDLFRRINHYGWVVKIFKTAFRSAFLGLVIYNNGLSSYIILVDKVNLGDCIYSGTTLSKSFNVVNGIALPLSYINIFSVVSNLELNPFTGVKLVRAAGGSAIVSTKQNDIVLVKLSNGVNLFLSDYVFVL